MAEISNKLLHSDRLIKIYVSNNTMNDYIIVGIMYVYGKNGVSQKTNKDLC